MDIDKLSDGLSNLDYYNDSFRDVLEDHLTYLKTLAGTKTIPIDAYLATRYEYDFFGFMQQQKVPMYLHWLTMRLTGYTSPDQMSPNLQSYVLADPQVVESIRSIWNSKSGVS